MAQSRGRHYGGERRRGDSCQSARSRLRTDPDVVAGRLAAVLLLSAGSDDEPSPGHTTGASTEGLPRATARALSPPQSRSASVAAPPARIRGNELASVTLPSANVASGARGTAVSLSTPTPVPAEFVATSLFPESASPAALPPPSPPRHPVLLFNLSHTGTAPPLTSTADGGSGGVGGARLLVEAPGVGDSSNGRADGRASGALCGHRRQRAAIVAAPADDDDGGGASSTSSSGDSAGCNGTKGKRRTRPAKAGSPSQPSPPHASSAMRLAPGSPPRGLAAAQSSRPVAHVLSSATAGAPLLRLSPPLLPLAAPVTSTPAAVTPTGGGSPAGALPPPARPVNVAPALFARFCAPSLRRISLQCGAHLMRAPLLAAAAGGGMASGGTGDAGHGGSGGGGGGMTGHHPAASLPLRALDLSVPSLPPADAAALAVSTPAPPVPPPRAPPPPPHPLPQPSPPSPAGAPLLGGGRVGTCSGFVDSALEDLASPDGDDEPFAVVLPAHDCGSAEERASRAPMCAGWGKGGRGTGIPSLHTTVSDGAARLRSTPERSPHQQLDSAPRAAMACQFDRNTTSSSSGCGIVVDVTASPPPPSLPPPLARTVSGTSSASDTSAASSISPSLAQSTSSSGVTSPAATPAGVSPLGARGWASSDSSALCQCLRPDGEGAAAAALLRGARFWPRCAPLRELVAVVAALPPSVEMLDVSVCPALVCADEAVTALGRAAGASLHALALQPEGPLQDQVRVGA